MKKNERFIEDCNNCAHCNLTEQEQNVIYSETQIKPEHKCCLHNKRILHNCNKDGTLYPCEECKGWDFINKHLASYITPYIKEQLLYVVKKDYELQIALGNKDKIKQLLVFYSMLTGELPDMTDMWLHSKYIE